MNGSEKVLIARRNRSNFVFVFKKKPDSIFSWVAEIRSVRELEQEHVHPLRQMYVVFERGVPEAREFQACLSLQHALRFRSTEQQLTPRLYSLLTLNIIT